MEAGKITDTLKQAQCPDAVVAHSSTTEGRVPLLDPISTWSFIFTHFKEETLGWLFLFFKSFSHNFSQLQKVSKNTKLARVTQMCFMWESSQPADRETHTSPPHSLLHLHLYKMQFWIKSKAKGIKSRLEMLISSLNSQEKWLTSSEYILLVYLNLQCKQVAKSSTGRVWVPQVLSADSESG